jgi:hypothetical protein
MERTGELIAVPGSGPLLLPIVDEDPGQKADKGQPVRTILYIDCLNKYLDSRYPGIVYQVLSLHIFLHYCAPGTGRARGDCRDALCPRGRCSGGGGGGGGGVHVFVTYLLT